MDEISKRIANALKEDVGDGDHSALSCIPANANNKAQLLIKQNGTLSGIDIAKRVFEQVDPKLEIEILISDGSDIAPGEIAMIVSGSARSILTGERLALNYLQRMSGIATTTRQYVTKVEGTKAKILDTRKTSPGLRVFEKLAVTHGGGHNHRFGLYDMIMLKDNHIDFAGGISEAIKKATDYISEKDLNIGIEVESRNLKEVEEILKCNGVQRIMLDNFTIEDTKKAVGMIDSRLEIESSGGITLETIRPYAECDVDYISVGALTHQIASLDMSLKAI